MLTNPRWWANTAPLKVTMAVHQDEIEHFLEKLQGDVDAGDPVTSSQVVLGKRKPAVHPGPTPTAKSMKITNASGEATFDLTGMRQVQAILLPIQVFGSACHGLHSHKTLFIPHACSSTE